MKINMTPTSKSTKPVMAREGGQLPPPGMAMMKETSIGKSPATMRPTPANFIPGFADSFCLTNSGAIYTKLLRSTQSFAYMVLEG